MQKSLNNFISSINNERIKDLSKLQQKKYRTKENKYIINGLKAIKEANDDLKLIVTTDTTFTSDITEILYVSEQVMYKIYPFKPVVSYIGVCEIKFNSFNDEDVVVLNKIKDPGNLGSIIRNAKAFGFENILIDEQSVDLFNDKVLRALQGAHFNLNILIGDAFKYLSEHNYNVITTFLDQDNHYEVDSQKIALVLGNESSGVEENFKALNSGNFKIDIDFESLNVASASAIALYEIRRSRK